MKDILDHDHEEPLGNPLEGKKIRPLAMILEGLPLFFTLVGYFLSPAITIISLCILFMIYLAMSWYIFKAKKFTPGTVLFAIFNGICLSAGTYVLLFSIMDWESEPAMSTIPFYALPIGLTISIVWYILRKNEHVEFTLSLKLISRYVFYILLIYATWSA